MNRTSKQRVLSILVVEAGEGVKVELTISPSLLRRLASRWPRGSVPPPQLDIYPETHNIAVRVHAFDREAPVVELTVVPAVEDLSADN